MATDFYIINDMDAPDERHVVINFSGIGRYNLADDGIKGYQFGHFENATKLQDFGFTIKEVSNGYYAIQDKESIAKYKDGEKRRWQGSKEFIIT